MRASTLCRGLCRLANRQSRRLVQFLTAEGIVAEVVEEVDAAMRI